MNTDTASPDARLREALARPRTWQAVAVAYRVIEEDLQGPEKLLRSRLAMSNQIARFHLSVALQAGQVAVGVGRRFNEQAPKKPMTLAEAYAFVSRLSMAWSALRQRATA